MKDNDSLLKLLIIISLFFFLLFAVSLFNPSPANAQLFTPVIPNEILAPKTYDGNTYSNYALIYGYNNFGDGIGWNLIHLKDGGTINLMCGQGNYGGSDTYIACGHRTISVPGINHSVHPTYYFFDNGQWVSKSGLDVIQIGANDNRANIPSYYILSTVDVAFYNPYKVQYYAWMYGGTGTTYLANTYYPLFSANLNYGYSGEPVISPNYQYYLEYYDSDFPDGYIRIETNDIIEMETINGINEYNFIFSGDYTYSGMNSDGFAISTPAEDPPSLEVIDLDNPCSNIISSNIYIYDYYDGSYICTPKVKPIVKNLVSPFTGIINYDTDTDLGMFEPIEPVIVWLTSAIDGIAIWWHNLWSSFIDQIVPSSDLFAYFALHIKLAFQENFPTELIDTITEIFEDMENMTDDEIPVIQGSLLGTTVNFVDFSLIDSSMYIIRPILTGMLIFIIVVTYIKLFQLYFAKN